MTVIATILYSCYGKGDNSGNIDYLGQEPPGTEPEVFAPGIVSIHETVDFALSFTRNGKEAYFSRFVPGKNLSIMFLKRENGEWSEPVVAPFSGRFRDGTPYISNDGQKLFFTSWRPLNPGKEPEEIPHIWMLERENYGEWSEPEIIEFKPGSSIGEWNPCITSDGYMYFNGNFGLKEGDNDIYFSGFNNGSYSVPVNPGDNINTEFIEVEPAVSPDGSYMIFYSAGRPDQMGKDLVGDLYISFKQTDGSWGKAVNMGKPVNSDSEENWPRISPDGKYIFFSSNRDRDNHMPDIYWINASIIEGYK